MSPGEGGGLAEISSHCDNGQPNNIMTNDEATPLASNLYRRVLNKSRSSPSTNSWLQWAAGATAITIVVAVGAVLWPKRSDRTANEPPYLVEEEPSNPTVMYRPTCEYYRTYPSIEEQEVGDGSGSRPPVRLEQTSMREPSQLWSEKPCFPASQVEDAEAVPLLNSFGAPDAVLRVNFSAPAFVRNDPILGFGGAFTEAAALNYQSLSKSGQDAVMELLFGKSGLGYSIGRVHINSCDFSVRSYSFDETVDDFELIDFDMNVQHDAQSGMTDMALRAISVHREAWGTTGEDVFKLYASPWSPPAWMKSPTWEDPEGAEHASKMTYSAQPVCLREGVGPDSRYARAWALYFSKFLTAYKNLGLPIWAVTVQNEPEFPAPWEACSYSPETQRDFVHYHLGPRLKEDHPDIKLFIFDHNKDHINIWAEALLNASSEAAPYVDGTAYHWYAGGTGGTLIALVEPFRRLVHVRSSTC
jgi:glucosylceramidase